jgi:small subunit ribosomal protein S20
MNILYFSKCKSLIKTLPDFLIFMANNKSAKKRILIAKRNRLQNRFYKTSVRTLTKLFLQTVETYKVSPTETNKIKIQELLSLIYSLIDKGCKKNIYHKNSAARKKSKLALQFKEI